MARRKNYFNFNDFNFVDGAVDLFHNSIRKSFEFDAYTDDVFDARVLTTPTPIVNNEAAVTTVSLSTSNKLSFRVRILGPLSPHRFLEDPCNMSDASNTNTANHIFSIIQNHTQVFLYKDDSETTPVIGDIVRIKLAKSGHSFDTRRAKQYLGKVNDAPDSGKTPITSDCSTLEDLFKNFDFDTLGSPSNSVVAMQVLINIFEADSLPVIQLLLPTMGNISIGSTIRTTEYGRGMIWRIARDNGISSTITEAQAATNPAEVERLRQEIKKNTGQDVARPEESNHNPQKEGKIAIDLQIPGENSPSYDALATAIEIYRDSNYTPSFGYRIRKVHRERNNGTSQCPPKSGKKCGVVHIELTPLNAVSTTSAGVASAAGTPPAGVHGPTPPPTPT